MNSIDDFFDTTTRSAVDTFTDRVPESEVFAAAISQHLARLDSDADASHRAPRVNVLTFYGVGGLGKSELSRRLEQWLFGALGDVTEWGTPPRTTRPLITTRIDLAEREVVDIERIVLDLRASFGEVDAQPHAFDIALALWWRHNHGDTPITLPVSPPTTRGETARSDLREQLKDTTVSVLEELGASFGLAELGIRVARKAHATRQLRRQRLDAEANPWFAPMLSALEERADLDTLSRLPVLLREDFRRLEAASRPLWVIFVDTYEHANDGADRYGERALQRIVYAMQDVLWVVTGRSRLDWADRTRAGQLDVVGSQAWPSLSDDPAATMQHRVGDLSDDDARRFVERALESSGQQLAADAVDMVVARAAGSPLFLDQFIKLARELIGSGTLATADVFDVSFAGLVQRVVRDLPHDERQALQFACVFPRFSASLAVQTSNGALTEAAILRLQSRGLITHQTWPLFDLKVHDSLRTQIRQLRPDEGGWTANDWRIVAARGLAAVDEVGVQKQMSAAAAIDCFSLGMSVSLEFAIDAPWLLKAAGNLPSLATAALSVPPGPGRGTDSYAAHLAAVLQCWTPSDDGRERFDRLAEVAQRSGIPREVYAFTQRFRAYSMRNHGDWDGALQVFRQLLDEGAAGRVVSLRQRAILAHSTGRFQEAVAAVDESEALGSPPAAVAVIRGGISRWHGMVDDAVRSYRSRYLDTSSAGRHRMARENLSDLLQVEALVTPVDLVELGARAEEIKLGGMDNQHRAASMALAMAAAGQEPQFSEAMARLTQSFTLPPEPGDSGHTHVWRLQLPRAFHLAVVGSDEVFDVHIDHPMWSRVATFWAALVDPHRAATPEPADWLEPESVVRERWQKVVLERRRWLGLTSGASH